MKEKDLIDKLADLIETHQFGFWLGGLLVLFAALTGFSQLMIWWLR